MESINLNNYEAFFLDFIEENLSAENEQMMLLFLDENPDLQIEFSELTGTSFVELALKPNKENSFSKETLKAEPSIISALTIDQWMVDSVENKLSQSENAELLTYISKHKLESKFIAYQATILTPNKAETYGNNSNLKRQASAVFSLWVKVGATAAAITLLIVVLNQINDNQTKRVANNNPTLIESQNMASLGRQVFSDKPRLIKQNSSIDQLNDVKFENNMIVREDASPIVDSVDILSPKIVNNLVEEKRIDSSALKILIPNLEPEDHIAIHEEIELNKTVEEEPYKIFTKTASNMTNRQVSFTRTLNTESDVYVAYHFKIGKFEFERKKRSK